MKTTIAILAALTIGAGQLKADDRFAEFERRRETSNIERQQQAISEQIERSRQEADSDRRRDRYERQREKLEHQWQCDY